MEYAVDAAADNDLSHFPCRRALSMADNWTDEQNDAIVADYFAMLADDIVGHPYNKAKHNRGLQRVIDRSEKSIEYKHRNISAVLKGFGEVWILGYKPAFNFQISLRDAVARWLDRHPNWLAPAMRTKTAGASSTLQEPAALWIGPPPTHSNAPPPDELEQMLAIARKYDIAERDARNRALGRAGEERVLAHERATLLAAGRTDLAGQIRWTSEIDGDGAGYDIKSFDADGSDRLIEVKTTNGWERTPFHITRNELAVAEAYRDDWLLVRLWNFAREARAFELRPPLEAHVSLMATSYQASFP
jgi:Domain of unknown function (DUF3883)